MRVVVCAALLCASGIATADPSASFRRWARAYAQKQDLRIERWGEVQLDGDAALERFAFVCEEGAEEGTIVIEKDAKHRWVMQREAGKPSCNPPEKPTWSTKPEAGLEIFAGGSHDSLTVTLGLREGGPVIVTDLLEEHHIPDSCSEERLRYDELVYEQQHCVTPKRKDDPSMSPPTHGAVLVIDGPSGAYRSATSGAPQLDVAATQVGKRARIGVTLSRPASDGDVVSFYTETEHGKPMAWTATRHGAWALSRWGAAPRELPEVTGDSTHVAVPIVQRMAGPDDSPRTPLCVAYRGADGTRVATCDLNEGDSSSFGVVIGARWRKPDGLERP